MLPVPALCTPGAAVPVTPVKLTDVGDASARGAAQCTQNTAAPTPQVSRLDRQARAGTYSMQRKRKRRRDLSLELQAHKRTLRTPVLPARGVTASPALDAAAANREKGFTGVDSTAGAAATTGATAAGVAAATVEAGAGTTVAATGAGAATGAAAAAGAGLAAGAAPPPPPSLDKAPNTLPANAFSSLLILGRASIVSPYLLGPTQQQQQQRGGQGLELHACRHLLVHLGVHLGVKGTVGEDCARRPRGSRT